MSLDHLLEVFIDDCEALQSTYDPLVSVIVSDGTSGEIIFKLLLILTYLFLE